MTDTRKPIGANLQMTDPDHVKIWKFICDMMRQHGISQGQVIRDALVAYAHMQAQPSIEKAPIAYATADNSDVVQAINEGFATMAKLLQNISVVQASVPQSAEYGTQELPPTMTDATVEWEAIDPNVPTPFLRGIKKVAKPGMRLES